MDPSEILLVLERLRDDAESSNRILRSASEPTPAVTIVLVVVLVAVALGGLGMLWAAANWAP